MILESFAIFALIAVGVSFLGNMLKDDPLRLLGGIFLILIGFWSLTSGIQYESGQTIASAQTTTTEGNSTISAQNQTITNTYSDVATPGVPANEVLFLILISIGIFEAFTATTEMFIGKSIQD